MEDESTGRPSVDDDDVALAEIADDRRALVRKVSWAYTWYYPALALFATSLALVIVIPKEL